MPGKVIKDLYLATSLDDLINRTKIRTLMHPIKQLENSAKQLRESGLTFLKEGDEEKSYVMFMKFMEIALYVKKQRGVSAEEFERMFGSTNVNNAMITLEKLKQSLRSRYSELENKGINKAEPERKMAVVEENGREVESFRKDQYNGATETLHLESSISSCDLRRLIAEGKYTILIIDTRPADDFAKSHMRFSSAILGGIEGASNKATIISVPKEVIRRGLIPSSLEKIIPSESVPGWRNRFQVDIIVLLDWDSEHCSLKSESAIYILKEIMTQWEVNFSYKQHPVVLDRGYFDWINTFPMMTTNPHIEGPSKPKSLNAIIPSKDVYLASLLNEDDILDDLDDVVYPSLIDSPTKVIAPPFTMDEASADIMPVIQSSAAAGQSTPEKRTTPVIDRSSKPTTAGVPPQRMSISTPSPILKKKSVVTSNIDDVHETLDEKTKELENIAKGREEVGEIESSEVAKKFTELDPKKEEKNLIISNDENHSDEDRGVHLNNAKVPPVDRSLKTKILEQLKKDGGEERNSLLEPNVKNGPKKINNDFKEDDRIEDNRNAEENRSSAIDNNDKPDRKLKSNENKEKEIKQQNKRNEGDVWITKLKSEPSPGSTGMKRSHSLQNVSRLVDDQECPKYNRSIKPVNKTTEIIATRRRNFDGVYGNVGRGLTGLRNLGNSCYMNSILQCINQTTTLVKYFCDGKYRDDINRSTKMRGEVAEEVAALVRALWSGDYRSIACRDLKGVVGMHKKAFAGCEQQDSHEFLTILMDWLHEDLNKAEQKMIMKSGSNSESSAQGASGPEGSMRAWKEFCRKNESLVLQLFYGQQASTVRCLQCAEQSVTYEPFSNLSLPLPANATRCTLSDCMSLYLKGEHITGWNCPRCKEPRDAIKKFDIWILPRILVIHFKRFTSDGWCRKRQTLVEFPLEDLDASSWVGMEVLAHAYNPVHKRNSSLYNLYGVSNHYGTMDGGHYTAHCKSSLFNKWYKFDDHEVSELSPSEVVSPAAYILFYSSVDVS